jgi:hypothetical protein
MVKDQERNRVKAAKGARADGRSAGFPLRELAQGTPRHPGPQALGVPEGLRS